MYKKERKSWLKHLDFTILDMFLFQIAYMLSYWVRFEISSPYTNEYYRNLAIMIVMLQTCITFLIEPYKNILKRKKIQEFKAVISQVTMVFLGLILYMFVMKQSNIYSRQVLFVFGGMAIILSYIGHILLKFWIRKKLWDEKNRKIMLLITTNAIAETCIRDFEKIHYRDYSIKGIVILDKLRQGEWINQIPVVANADNYMRYIQDNVIDEVFINLKNMDSSERMAKKLLEMGITVHYKLTHESIFLTNKVVEKYGPYLVMTSSMKIASPRELFLKRGMDILGSLFGLLLAGIVYILFAPIIKKQSPGPILFSQMRVGQNGRQFKMYKFRSMYLDAEQRKKELLNQNKMNGFMFKIENDPRIFPIGKFMRKYSLDELPQFWNVLKGEMSLVGTRPPTLDEFQQYKAHHCARLGYKPGITGMWQVSGRSNITDFEEVVTLDTAYITNWNLGMDIQILLKTIWIVLSGNGAE